MKIGESRRACGIVSEEHVAFGSYQLKFSHFSPSLRRSLLHLRHQTLGVSPPNHIQYLLMPKHFHWVWRLGMGGRGVIGDRWSMRILWACAIGSAVSLYMVAVDRQLKNRERALAEELKAMEAESGTGEIV
ncbi:uncharacterized protein LOC125478563 isoform X2 [Pyrus x bretschneideri]|uniref:uncharacterized protein LOC125478563 isoform X2 n=1 Tax=Pyrus x bretschneideri TaxID=225117 RepID=UPI00202E3397|nr:uncharacterized protein LOC125478563 isoform X2 [Pyrus x bretschneideri]